jgi:hypothetical protein
VTEALRNRKPAAAKTNTKKTLREVGNE